MSDEVPTGVKLTGVRIENFRRFRAPFELDLCGPAGAPMDYVVLAGPNGSGKTTVIEAVLLALGMEALITRDLPAPDRAASPRVAIPAEAKLSVLLRDARRSPPLDVRVTRSGARHEVDFPGQPALVRRPFVWADWSPEVEYLSSRRTPALVGPIEQVANGRPPDATEANRVWLLKNRILQQQGRRANKRYQGPDPLDEVWLGRLNAFWREFRQDTTTFELAVVEPNNPDQTQWDLYLFEGDRRVCPVDALSSGELEVLAMGAPFVTRAEAFDGLLLFDEPELHMHPEWQGRIVPALRALCPDAQIIVATHADDPWDDAFTFQRFLLVPDSDPRSAKWRSDHAEEGEE